MATHSSIIAWKNPWTEKPGRLQSMGLQKSRTGLSDSTTTLWVKASDNWKEIIPKKLVF